MISDKITYHLTQPEELKRVDTDELAVIRNRRAAKRFRIQQTLNERILETIAIASIVSASFLGIGALGCWGLETIDALAKPAVLGSQEWRDRKHVFLGWMLVGFSSFFASSSLGEKPDQRR
ncbi:MAG: hypothetical protein KME40_31360 [Komarekiella atlantica HA4396-MV6]|jgi:hypothetical protein|nr:hypothetical protein [Komarekiella atlantica HA4396-MV6]